jgi:hypothetical protein
MTTQQQQIDSLTEENKNMYAHLLNTNHSEAEAERIAQGFDDWEDVDPNEPTPSQENERLRQGGW